MEREKKKYLYDIKTSIDSIDEILDGKRDFQEYLAKKSLRRAVERELSIIGEAVAKLLKIDPAFPLSEARKIVDFRNLLIHGYDAVDDRIVWTVVCKNLPTLKAEIEQLFGTSPEMK